MLDFRIHSFLTVCKYMNYTKAAEELCVTQPAVSQHIHYLEEMYQTKFFAYEGKKLKLTESGQLFYKIARTMKHDESYLMKELLIAKTGKRKLKFGATLTIGEFILPSILNQYLKDNKDALIEMSVSNTETLLSNLEDGKIDFAFLEGYFNKQQYDYIVFSLEDFICISGNQSGLSIHYEKVEDLLDQTLIVREEGSGTREVFEKNLELKDLIIDDFKQIMSIGNMNAIKYLVKENQGISFLYEKAVKDEIDRREIRKIEIDNFKVQHQFYFIWRKNSLFEKEYKYLADEFRKIMLNR